MNKTEVLSLLTTVVENAEPADMNESLDQAALTALTNAIAAEITDTVNPNGPCYPSTPR